MSQEEQGKKTSPVVSDAAMKEVIPAKPAVLSDDELDGVAGGGSFAGTISLRTGTLVQGTVTSPGNTPSFTVGRSKP